MQRPNCAIAAGNELVASLCRKWLDGLDHAVDERSERKVFKLKLHAPGLDLGEVEDVIDESKQMPAGAEDTVERLKVLPCRLRILAQHLADADDGVERRAQLMAHVGEELRLVLACLGELAALLLNFIEQPHVLDSDRRLVREGHH